VELRARVEGNILQHKLLESDGPVVLGISGGVDSMVLLHLIGELAAQYNWSITVAHLNHRLRGSASDGDEAFIREEARKLNFPFRSARSDVRVWATQKGVSIEMAGRELRHAFLMETAIAGRANRIAVAHHADDNIETFWLRLLRGEVGRGLAGIRWERSAGPETGIRLVRPLLNISKGDLLEYAKERNIAFREDASNADPAFQRNRLRLELLPRLEQFQPAIRDVTLRTIEVLGAEKAFLESEAQRWLEKPGSSLNELHIALQREIIRQQLMRLAVQPNFELIEGLRLGPHRPIAVSATERISCSASGFVSLEQLSTTQFSDEKQTINLQQMGESQFRNVSFCWEQAEARGAAELGAEYFDADLVGKRGLIRTWAPGDRFQPSGSSSESKLQDLLTNLKIPADEKRRRLVALAEDGKIFWVEGLRISERHKVTPQTRRVLKWGWKQVASSSG
jgi:tRNA(Ile)-lysidine synthase